MAEHDNTGETRVCAMCGGTFLLNPRYSTAQRDRARYCGRACAGKGGNHSRKPLLELMAGQTRFGLLTYVSEGPDRKATRRAIFRCDCGTVKPMGLNHILSGKVVSCGCEAQKRSRSRFTTHGEYRSAEYRSWNAMMQRCHNENNDNYPDYGGRGISVCKQWHGPLGVKRFIAYMGKRPDGMTLDRINNDGNYEPGNVRWATPTTQMNNRRSTRMLTHDGVTRPIADWNRDLGLSKNGVSERLRKGWSIADAVTVPAKATGAAA